VTSYSCGMKLVLVAKVSPALHKAKQGLVVYISLQRCKITKCKAQEPTGQKHMSVNHGMQ